MEVALEMGGLRVHLASVRDEVREVDCTLGKDVSEGLAPLFQAETQSSKEV